MRRFRLAVALAAGCGVAPTFPLGETQSPLTCSGDGLVERVPNECLDDSGSSIVDDDLEIYCCDHIARFCLSGEPCPWRDGCLDTEQTCSTAGLESEQMAVVRCARWKELASLFCSPDGVATFEDAP